jgi:hypothetical protein
MLEIVPMTLRDARKWVDMVHRHHPPPAGGLFAVGLADDAKIVGAAIVGRPVARGCQDGWTAEVTRVAVKEFVQNGNSKLYAACWRAARSLGYRKLITYTLETEPGTGVKAAGWKMVGAVRGRSWHTPSRPRIDKHPLQNKLRWEID